MVVDTIEVNFLAKEYGDIFSDGMPISYTWHKKGKKHEQVVLLDKTRECGPLNVLALNTCPEKGKGDIARLLGPYLEGMKSAGAGVELYYARDLTIFPCCGNLNCTVRTPGNCMAYDDMRWLRQKIGRADVLVLASPLYFNGTMGPEGATKFLRSLLGRLVPGRQPSAETPYEHAVHTTKESVNLRKVVFVTGCGFWEIEGLYPVLTHLKALCYNTFPDFAGNITGTYGVLLNGALKAGDPGSESCAISRRAGRRLALSGRNVCTDIMACGAETREIYDRVMAAHDDQSDKEEE